MVDHDALVLGAAHGFEHFFLAQGVGHGGDLGARNEDLLGEGVAELEDAVDHLALVLFEQGMGLGAADHRLELFFRHAVGHALFGNFERGE